MELSFQTAWLQMFVPFTSLKDLLAFADRLLETRFRQAEMLLTLMEFRPQPDLLKSGYLDALETLLVQRRDVSVRRMIRSTYFGMWLETLGRWFQSSERGHAVLPPPLDLGALDRLARRQTLREEDIPQFMRLLIPPSHTFRRAYQPDRPTEISEHSWERALHVAIANADRMMPGLNRVIETFAAHFLVLEDIDFRSCSADRYLGLILLSTGDQSLIDIEESVIHEVGHQFLYQLDRDRHLFHSHDDDREVELPWSGSHRNYFGFFHAAYIYLMLRDYYTRAAREHPFDRPYCGERLEMIQTGLDRAVPLLHEGRGLLTPPGLDLCNAMVTHIETPPVQAAASVAWPAPCGATM